MRKRVCIATCMIMVLFAASALAAPEMVLVKAGTFQMGDEVGDLPAWADARPLHTVTLTYDFWIGKYAVTFEEYDAFCDATGKAKPGDEGWGRGRRPVIEVSWRDAIEYCNWLSIQNGLAPAYDNEGNLLDRNGQITTDITQVEGYRLPTEAEFEYAARGGHKSEADYKYAGSDDIDQVAWYLRNRPAWGTQPVGEKDPNELGLYDMTGNVWEWCHDRFGSYTSENKTNPIGPSTGSNRVIRGGSWYIVAQNCRVAYRFNAPCLTNYSLGFRLSRTLF